MFPYSTNPRSVIDGGTITRCLYCPAYDGFVSGGSFDTLPRNLLNIDVVVDGAILLDRGT